MDSRAETLTSLTIGRPNIDIKIHIKRYKGVSYRKKEYNILKLLDPSEALYKSIRCKEDITN